MVELSTINMIIKIYALAGFCVAAYAFYAETSLENDPDFKPLCDIRDYVNCSPAFQSPYAKGFGIVGYVFGEDVFFNVPNGLVGMIFYTVSFLLKEYYLRGKSSVLSKR
ncbi:vitamin K epoxide reductase complex subunit 1-like protein 1 isoform X2 [Sipha flava]|uniref:vitamin-K-epoxide reductase (warfarin-sensitive) n=1 Tax=Sipha flava TaxID=143950 RepID=A0A8B8GRK2_9HEMI|nr:vitamin K epoxide reductase complex subunit 1-like protein 1 isoform X2 [Sipha flava]